jgi:hypothetical protein
MPTELAGVATLDPATISVPAPGDLRSAASVEPAFQSLLDKHAFNRAQQVVVERNVVRDYAAPVGGADATAQIQAAVDAANADYVGDGMVRRVRVPPGRYGITPSAVSSWNMPLVGTTAQMHIGVQLKSGVILECDGAEFVALLPVGHSATWHYALFGTHTFNTAAGTYKRIKMVKPRFDFTKVYWTTEYSNLIGVVAVSVDDLEIVDPVATATSITTPGSYGRTGKFLNCRRLKLPGLEAYNVSQGAYFAYCDDVRVSAKVDGAHEGLDFDAPCKRVQCVANVTNGTGSEKQGVDISSCTDSTFDITGENIGNLFIVYQKADGHPTFADWVTNLPISVNAAAPVFCKRVKIKARGKNIHSADLRSFQVNLYRDDAVYAGYWDGKGHIEDIELDVRIQDCDPGIVYECDGLSGKVVLRDVTTSTVDEINNAALTLRTAYTTATSRAESKLSGWLDVEIVNSTRAGVMISAPSDFELRSCKINGYNSADDATSGVASGVWCRNLGRRDGTLTLGPIVSKNGDTTVPPVDLRLTYDGATGSTRIKDKGGHRFTTVGTAYTVANTADYQGNAVEYLIASVDTSSVTTDYTLPKCVAKGGMRLVAAHAINLAAITGTSGTNYSSLSMRRMRAGAISSAIGTDTPYDNVDRAAGAVVSLQVDGTDTDGAFVAGDILQVRATRNGTGSTRANIMIRFVFAEFAT